MTWPNGIAVEETIMALSAKLTVTETRLAEAEALLATTRKEVVGYIGRVPERRYLIGRVIDRIDAFLNRESQP